MKQVYSLTQTIEKKSILSILFLLILFTSYQLKAQPLSGNYNVGSGQTYTTITAAVADVISKGVSAAVTFTLMDASYTTAETYPITVTAISGASATNTISIRPFAILPSVTISSANATATFDLNGVSYFTIDGRPGGSGTFVGTSIINTNASGVAIRITNDATNNTIKYCDVKGQNTVSVPAITTAAGVIWINSANSTNLVGNDNNVITYCKVHGTGTTTSTFPTIGICAFGTTTTVGSYNDNCTISNCSIYDIYNSSLAATHIKIDLGNTAWTLSDNHLYQTTSIDYTSSAAVYRFLWVTPNVSNINNAANGFVITGNFLGGNTAAGTGTCTMTGSGTYSFWAADISVGLGAATSIQNNTFTNFDITSANTGSAAVEFINIANGNANVGTVTGNLIGSTTSTPGITYTALANTGGPIGIRTGGGTGNVINISNNIVGGIVLNSSTSVAGIFNGIAASGGTTVNVTNNTIGSATIANSINLSAASTSASIQSVRGIILNGSGTTGTVSGNLIANMNTNIIATGTQANTVVGIQVTSAAGAYNITGNTIRNLTSASQTTSTGSTCAVLAIAYVTTTGATSITGNTIHSLKLTNTSSSAAACVEGIYFNGPSGTNTIDKNFIHSLSNTSSVSTGYIRGIDLGGGSATVMNNMIRLGTDETGAAITNSLTITGINEDGGTNGIYFNSAVINGAGVGSGAMNTAAFGSSLTSTTREIKDNIFYNTRTNAASTGKHYAVKIAGTTSQTIVANDYWNGSSFLSQIGTNDYTSFSSWKAATGQDTLSFSQDPRFKNSTGSATTVNLHIDTTGTANTLLESGGTNITGINTDIDNDARPGPAGSTKGGGTRVDIGADEFDGVPFPQCLNPNAGVATAAVDTVCYNTNVTFSLNGATGTGVGISYQWQISTDGINYFNINAAQATVVIAVTSTAYYRCVLTCIFGNTTSTSSAKKIIVINPQIISNTPAQSCGPGVMTLKATADMGKISWYANATGGTALDTGTTYTTPSLSVTTTFYVEAVFKGCASGSRTAVVATVRPIPTITGVVPAILCGPGSVTLSASTAAGVIDWYTSATGGTSINTGLSYSTPSLSTSTTYYVGVTANGCVSASRTPVTATIIPLPFITATTPSGTCGSGTVVLGATANVGTIYWYTASSGGTLLDTGTTFTTPVIFSPTTYYLEVRASICTSATRTSIVASIYSNPTINGTTAGSGCMGDKVTLGATASAGTINWYTSVTGGTSIATGTSFTTPPLTVTTTYYVDATNNGCTTSFRTPAKATINPLPTITGVTPASICGPGSLTLGASASSGLIAWYTDSVGGTLVGNGPSYITTSLSTTDTFYVDTKDNGCTSYPRVPVIAKIKKIPTITNTAPSSSCKPASLTLSATSSGGSVRWYSVAFGGGVLFSGSSFITPLLSSTTTYYVDAIDSGCVSASRTSVDATIYPALNKNTLVNGFTISAVANGLIYQWVDCNNAFAPINGETSQNFTATKNGSYAVIIKSANCTDTSACVPMTKIGINGITNEYGISVSPNPANEFLILKSDKQFVGSSFTLNDNIGRTLLSGTIISEIQKINIQEFVPGIYFLTVGEAQTFKITKE